MQGWARCTQRYRGAHPRLAFEEQEANLRLAQSAAEFVGIREPVEPVGHAAREKDADVGNHPFQTIAAKNADDLTRPHTDRLQAFRDNAGACGGFVAADGVPKAVLLVAQRGRFARAMQTREERIAEMDALAAQ